MRKFIIIICLLQLSILSGIYGTNFLVTNAEARIDVSVFDTQTALPIEDGYFSYLNAKNGKQVLKSFDEASFTVPSNTSLYINVYSQGYDIIKDSLFVKEFQHDTLINLIYALQKSSVTSRLKGKETGISFPSIYFDFGKHELKKESYPILMDITTFMHSNPNSRIEIGAFTDSRGSEDYNLSLSQKRAKASLNYLIAQGINSSRLKVKAYGSNKAEINCNHSGVCLEEEYSSSRQVKFKIVRSVGIDLNELQGRDKQIHDQNHDKAQTANAELIPKKHRMLFKNLRLK